METSNKDREEARPNNCHLSPLPRHLYQGNYSWDKISKENAYWKTHGVGLSKSIRCVMDALSSSWTCCNELKSSHGVLILSGRIIWPANRCKRNMRSSAFFLSSASPAAFFHSPALQPAGTCCLYQLSRSSGLPCPCQDDSSLPHSSGAGMVSGPTGLRS